jgi:hypothetical protein
MIRCSSNEGKTRQLAPSSTVLNGALRGKVVGKIVSEIPSSTEAGNFLQARCLIQ